MNNTATKKIGIVADNYKVKAFKKALNKAGFEYRKLYFTEKASLFTIETTEDKVKELERICKKVEIDVTRSN
ncbi:MAG: hypothetical protein ABJG41_09970 [Cyclobacteriaceae bacterium]